MLLGVKLTMGFQQWLTLISSSWWGSQATSLFRQLAEQGFDT
jgi:hypothetical protein